MHVLADAHAPEDQGSAGLSIHPGDLADGVSRDAAGRGHALRREVLDAVAQLLVALGVAGYILGVGQALGDDGVQHGVQQRHVAAGLEGQVVLGVAG